MLSNIKSVKNPGCCLSLAVALLAAAEAHAGSLKPLYSFPGGSDGYPDAGLSVDGAGNLYGTTTGDGSGGGTVFKLTPQKGGQWTETTLYSFCAQQNCVDGDQPSGGIIVDSSGDVYGTTATGGEHNLGTVFEITANGKEKVLYSFCSKAQCVDGEYPSEARLLLDGQGNLYGTTYSGGAYGAGTMFMVTSAGKENVQYSFCSLANCADGQYPNKGVIADAQGNLYGTTSTDAGVVFKLVPQHGGGWAESTLYKFCSQANCTDGEYPTSGLTLDAQGNFYGVTNQGGATNDGVVYEVTAKGKEKTLYNFCSQPECSDGVEPDSDLTLDAKGDLYGMTDATEAYAGVVFKLTPKGRETTPAYSDTFYGGGLIEINGHWYGTDYQGGSNNAGDVFQLMR